MKNLEHYLLLLKKKDIETYYHSTRVAYYSYLIGKLLNYDKEQLTFLITSALLHDIGKLYIPNSILKKPNQLTIEEFEIMKMHTLHAKDILKNYDTKLIDIISAHHERLDGSGYPNHLSENAIPYYAQILSVADSFDAMTSNRTYNHVKTNKQAIQELINCSIKEHNLYNDYLVSLLNQSLLIVHKQYQKQMKHYKS